MKKFFFLALFLSVSCVPLLPTWAFEFTHPSDGDVVMAGSALTVLIDPGKIDPLFGALLVVSRGVVQSKIDSLPPYKWEIDIPPDYYGPLTLWAIGRRFYPIPNPPRASVTIFVVYPVIPVLGRSLFIGSLPQQFH